MIAIIGVDAAEGAGCTLGNGFETTGDVTLIGGDKSLLLFALTDAVELVSGLSGGPDCKH